MLFSTNTVDSGIGIGYTYDYVGRVSAVARGSATRNNSGTISVSGVGALGTTYSYVASGYSAYGSNATTPLVASITHGCGMTFGYTYDNVGNITQETRNGATTTYVYDYLGQLTRVNDPNDTTSGSSGTTWVYNYDCSGNILSRMQYDYSTGDLGALRKQIEYLYNDGYWKDKLTGFRTTVYSGGQQQGDPVVTGIAYDAIGNPTGDGTWSYTWQAGRQLAVMENDDDHKSVSFTYNHDGLRTKKIVTEGSTNPTVTTTEYLLHGKLVTGLKQGNTELHFFYDAQSRPAAVRYNGTLYWYIHNLQGDIVAIVDTTGQKVIEYKYDAWGKPLAQSTLTTAYDELADLNPFRYRGYVWDQETELYYLRSRYYNPVWGRFVNSDSRLSIKGCVIELNTYNYSNNNVINRIDEEGNESKWMGLAIYTPELSNAVRDLGVIPWAYHSLFGDSDGYQSLRKIEKYDQAISASANEFGIEKEALQAVLFREIICYGPDDVIGDCFKQDASYGLGQIKPSTAIGAEKAVTGTCIYTLKEMKKRLANDETNIRYVAMNIRSIMMNNDIKNGHLCHEVGAKRNLIMMFARYNGSSINDDTIRYARDTYSYYCGFKTVNQLMKR